MLEIRTQCLGNVMIFHCTGRITIESADTLQMIVENVAPIDIVMLDLAKVTAIDAAGIGMLVSLRSWAGTNGIRLKLMNLTPKVEDLLELFNLTSVFEICSVPEMLGLLCRAFEHSRFVNTDEVAETRGGFLDQSEPVLAKAA